jgi:hypothetical protein
VQRATKDYEGVTLAWSDSDKLHEELVNIAKDAKAVLERCETAYSAATSVGLAAAFIERSAALSKSMWIWVAGLIAAFAGRTRTARDRAVQVRQAPRNDE